MAEEQLVATTSPVPSDHKRKLDDLDPEITKNAVSSPSPDLKTEISSSPPSQNQEISNSSTTEVQNAIQKAQEFADRLSNTPEAKRARLEEQTVINDLDHQVKRTDEPVTGNSQPLSTGDQQQPIPSASQRGDLQQPIPLASPQGDIFSREQPPKIELQNISRRIEVPNGKVGVLIGKAGETIRNLQFNSGAKIQITRDNDANPYSTTRAVEMIGTPENVNKAEQLIKDVIAEAEAGGSPALVAKGYGTAPTDGEQIQIQVPNEKVGLIIGKGGETIKNLQTRSGARIQLIPQHLPEGDVSMERTVRVTGNMTQIEAAREMIKDVMNKPVRSSLSGGYNQQSYRPRGPPGATQWGAQAPPPAQPAGYGYQQRGPYPSQAPQFPAQTYSSYPQQSAPRSTFNSGWDQRSQAPMQTQPQSGGYDYYGQASHVADTPGSAPSLAPTAIATPAQGPTQVNYNYGQSQGPPDYVQPTSYSQSLAPQQSYGHQGYDDPNYEKQASAQHVYGGPNLNTPQASYPQAATGQPGYMQPVSTQPVGYTQQGSATISGYPQQANAPSGYTQQGYANPTYGASSVAPTPQACAPSGYTQQGYGNPTYGTSSPGPVPVSYAPPRATSQPGDGSGGPVPSQSYGSAMPTQQSYPYGSSGQSQQSYPYGPTAGANDGYAQTQQPTNGGGYGQYPSTQPGYGDQQQTQNNANYGYQGPADTGYNSQQTSAYGGPTGGYSGTISAYGAPTNAGGGYVQPASNLPSNEQPAPQSGYGNAGVPAAGYSKSLSPQPGYNQYDSGQMYGRY